MGNSSQSAKSGVEDEKQLEQIPAPAASPDESDEVEYLDPSQDLEALATWDLRERELKLRGMELSVQKREIQLRSEIQMTSVRKYYAFALFGASIAWMCFIACVIKFSAVGYVTGGCIFPTGQFSLPEAVLIALVTTTTINVLGLFYVVAKWLFPRPLPVRSSESDV